jgi:hypothetical protein
MVQPGVGDASEPVLAELAGSSNVSGEFSPIKWAEPDLGNLRKRRGAKHFTDSEMMGGP